MPDNKEGFVSRWSRRKQQVAEEKIESENIDENTSNVTKQDFESDIDPEILKAEKIEALNKLTDEDMPDIETLDEHSDFSGFMSTGVSEGLRRMALKKLFMGASYNIRDGLDEYDGDYTKFEKMPKDMITTDMKHMAKVEARKKLEKEQEEARQKMLAEYDIDEFDEFDEFADDDDIDEEIEVSAVETEVENYVDEYINVEGFDTTNTSEESLNNTDNTKDNEEVA